MRDTLGPFEYQVLQVLQLHPNDAYGVSIGDHLEERTGKRPSIGALYTTLDRLEAKGYVSSSWGEATAERGGRRKKYFKLQAAGQFAMTRTQAAYGSMSHTSASQPAWSEG